MNNLPQRKQLRLINYDYSQPGYYFITICTQDKRKILSNIVGNDALVVPSPTGKKVIDCWNNISKLNKNIETDLFCLMPNHIHGIIIIENVINANTQIDDDLDKKYGFETAERWGHRSLQGVIRDFKSVSTRYHNKIMDDSLKNTLWQKSYYEHVIRNKKELNKIREYIQDNALKWQDDIYYV